MFLQHLLGCMFLSLAWLHVPKSVTIESYRVDSVVSKRLIKYTIPLNHGLELMMECIDF